MSSYPFLSIHNCSESITNADFVDINFASVSFINIPTITVSANKNINTFLSNVTVSSARINFSAKFTGIVYYTVIGFK